MSGSAFPPVAIILGPPGAGKTSMGRRLAREMAFKQISSGDLLRSMSTGDGPVAAELREKLAAGIPPDAIACDAVLAELSASSVTASGFLLDGFPRTMQQAHALDTFLAARDSAVAVLLYLSVSHETALVRLTRRAVCHTCGPVSIGASGECPSCEGPVQPRWGDRAPETLRQRRSVFYRDSGPVLDYYGERGLLVSVDAEQPADEVFAIASQSLVTRVSRLASNVSPA